MNSIYALTTARSSDDLSIFILIESIVTCLAFALFSTSLIALRSSDILTPRTLSSVLNLRKWSLSCCKDIPSKSDEAGYALAGASASDAAPVDPPNRSIRASIESYWVSRTSYYFINKLKELLNAASDIFFEFSSMYLENTPPKVNILAPYRTNRILKSM